MFILIATLKKYIFIKATKVIQSRAASDFLFFFCFLIHINTQILYITAISFPAVYVHRHN